MVSDDDDKTEFTDASQDNDPVSRGPFRILLIAGPMSGRRVDVPELSEGELFQFFPEGTDDDPHLCQFLYYEQDNRGSHNYYFNQRITDWMMKHKDAALKKWGKKFTPKELT